MMPIAIACDLRKQFGPVRNQGQRMTCFAASDAHAAARGDPTPLSSEYAHYHAIRRKGSADPDAGVSLRVMSATLTEDGQPHECGWPYLPRLPADLALWRPPTDCGPIYRRGSTLLPASIDALCSSIDVGKPVVFTMRISEAFYRWDNETVIDGPAEEPPRGVHALVALGHGMRGSDKVVLVRNSWGAAWGKAGCAWLTAGYLEPRLCGMATMN